MAGAATRGDDEGLCATSTCWAAARGAETAAATGPVALCPWRAQSDRSSRRHERQKADRLPPTRARIIWEMVRSRGLEPPRVAPLAPQASASTSSATTASARTPGPQRSRRHGNGAACNKSGMPVQGRHNRTIVIITAPVAGAVCSPCRHGGTSRLVDPFSYSERGFRSSNIACCWGRPLWSPGLCPASAGNRATTRVAPICANLSILTPRIDCDSRVG